MFKIACRVFVSGNNFCDEDPCLNGGTCHNEPFGFRCQCSVGFSGDTCSKRTFVCPYTLVIAHNKTMYKRNIRKNDKHTVSEMLPQDVDAENHQVVALLFPFNANRKIMQKIRSIIHVFNLQTCACKTQLSSQYA